MLSGVEGGGDWEKFERKRKKKTAGGQVWN